MKALILAALAAVALSGCGKADSTKPLVESQPTPTPSLALAEAATVTCPNGYRVFYEVTPYRAVAAGFDEHGLSNQNPIVFWTADGSRNVTNEDIQNVLDLIQEEYCH